MALLKTAGDSVDINIDGGVLVKHGKTYRNTPGYADTTQLYSLAGSGGLILGANDYVGSRDEPYNPPTSSQPSRHVRFELGPRWPESERMRLNNSGDLIIGWASSRRSAGSQAGTRVTAGGAIFQPSDVGRFVCWGDATSGESSDADRILAVIDSYSVEVETAREIPPQAFRVQTPLIAASNGSIGLGAFPLQQAGTAGRALVIADSIGAPLVALDAGGMRFIAQVERDPNVGGVSLAVTTFGNLNLKTDNRSRLVVDGSGNLLLRGTSRAPLHRPAEGVNLFVNGPDNLTALSAGHRGVLFGRVTWTGIGDFANGWGPAGISDYHPLMYSVSADSRVSLRGLVRCGSPARIAWRMPPSVRPSRTVLLPAVTGLQSPTITTLKITPAGEVTAFSPLQEHLSLDGIAYYL
jgi:hypothetical protein